MTDYRDAFTRHYRLIRWYRGAVPDYITHPLSLDGRAMHWLAGSCYLAREPRLAPRAAYLGRQGRFQEPGGMVNP